MMAFLIAVPLVLTLLAAPVVILYLLLTYMVLNGLASRQFMSDLKLTVGTVNIFPLDVLFAVMTVLIPLYFLQRGLGANFPDITSRPAKIACRLVAVYLLFHLGRFISGYIEGVPVEALIRLFYQDAQAIYFFLPLLFIRQETQLRNVLGYLVIISMIFPFGQLMLSSHEDMEFVMKGADILRLGFGDSTIFASTGLLALSAWEWRLPLLALPASSIIMLAHRSAYIGIVVALMAMAIEKKKKVRTAVVMGVVSVVVLAILYGVQSFRGLPVFERGMKRVGQTVEATGTTKARWHAIIQVLGVWSEQPAFGIGYKGLYELRKNEVTTASSFNVVHPHNFVLSAMGQTGAVGTALLLWIITHTLFGARKLASIPQYREIGAFLLGSLLFFLIFALMNTTMSSAGFFFWILAGSTFWYLNRAKMNARLVEKL